ncbi:MAG: IMP dehydrogenase [Spirochaetota bacterium]|nr:MAG: IMP dehydrogenase [Spirochaetota bacterium]
MTEYSGYGMTFDDVLLEPRYSSILPAEVDLVSRLKNIKLNIPIISAAMDTVSEYRMAIALSREGGLSVIHRNLTIDEQAAEVEKVKRSQSGMIMDPVTLGLGAPVKKAMEIMRNFRVSGIPITENEKLVGILTNRDLRFIEDFDQPVEKLMTKKNLITAPEGTTLDEAKKILQKYKIEKLPIVDNNNRLIGLITIKDIQKAIEFPTSALDEKKRLVVAAAVGPTSDLFDRVDALLAVNLDAIVVDTAHGHTKKVADAVRQLRERYKKLCIIAGNVATKEGAQSLIDAGADIIKVGVGPGSICTTRIISGVGVPQLTAIMDCYEVTKKNEVALIADGGVRYSGDIVKALAAGADAVMIGSIFAGTDESPGEKVIYQGRSFKEYRGMGSEGAMRSGSSYRYEQEGRDKFVPEGVEGLVPYKGSVRDIVYQLVGGIKAGMGYVGAQSIDELRKKARFIKISFSSTKESHVHDVQITKEPPNYFFPDYE